MSTESHATALGVQQSLQCAAKWRGVQNVFWAAGLPNVVWLQRGLVMWLQSRQKSVQKCFQTSTQTMWDSFLKNVLGSHLCLLKTVADRQPLCNHMLSISW